MFSLQFPRLEFLCHYRKFSLSFSLGYIIILFNDVIA